MFPCRLPLTHVVLLSLYAPISVTVSMQIYTTIDSDFNNGHLIKTCHSGRSTRHTPALLVEHNKEASGKSTI